MQCIKCDMGVQCTACGTVDNICTDTQCILGKAMLCLVPSDFAPCAFFYYVEYLLKILN